MLTKEQQNWLDRLSDTDSVKIIPFDPSCKEIFEKVKREIQAKLGEDLRVEHHGASSLGISGQDEIDVYILVKAAEFEKTVLLVEGLFGEPKSLGVLKRARFRTAVDGKKIDLFVANEEHEEWRKHQRFKAYLCDNSQALDEYRNIKENSAGKSTREYYRAKLEFINDVLGKV